MQKFPNHFHDYYVIGFVEGGKRHLWCRDQDYAAPFHEVYSPLLSIAPFFTVIFSCIILHDTCPTGRFFLGFLIAVAGLLLSENRKQNNQI